MKFKIVDHTGDVGVIVYGKNFSEILKNSVQAVSRLVFPTTRFKPDAVMDVRISGESNELLLIDLISHIISLMDSEEMICFDADLTEVSPEHLMATLHAMRIVSEMDYEYVLKAVTYHDLEIDLRKGFARILFDV